MSAARVTIRAGVLAALLVAGGCGGREAETARAGAADSTGTFVPRPPLKYGESIRIFADTVRLAPGEVRAWNLEVGSYDIAVRPTVRGARSPLELVADITCATDGADVELIHCVVRSSTRFVLRHRGTGTDSGRASAFVSISQVP